MPMVAPPALALGALEVAREHYGDAFMIEKMKASQRTNVGGPVAGEFDRNPFGFNIPSVNVTVTDQRTIVESQGKNVATKYERNATTAAPRGSFHE